MSNAMNSGAQLPGYNFTNLDSVSVLQTLIAELPCLNGETIERTVKKLKGYMYRERVTTSDNYEWFWSIVFKRNNSLIKILFPWAQDWKSKDGTRTDRHIAVYAQGSPALKELELLIFELCNAFDLHQRKEISTHAP